MMRLCVKAGVSNCTPYGYRHSFGTEALVRSRSNSQKGRKRSSNAVYGSHW